jgi:hypothetical protein
MAIDFGDLPTWVAAVGTVGALGAGLWQIGNERQLRLKQEAKDRETNRREQARSVACWPGPQGVGPGPLRPWWEEATPIDLVNGSVEPVYNVVFAIVLVQGAGAPRRAEDWKERAETQHDVPMSTAAILPPGTWRVWVPGSHWDGGMGPRLGAEMAFSDRAGIAWIRRCTGELEELDKTPFDYFAEFGLHGPLDLQIPQPATPAEQTANLGGDDDGSGRPGT